jgi:hypothetical protein
VIKDEPEVLAMFREAVTNPKHKHVANTDNDNVIISQPQGNSKSYTLDRLKRERKDLFDAVCRKERLLYVSVETRKEESDDNIISKSALCVRVGEIAFLRFDHLSDQKVSGVNSSCRAYARVCISPVGDFPPTGGKLNVGADSALTQKKIRC